MTTDDLSLALNKIRPSKTVKFDKNIKINARISNAGERPASKKDLFDLVSGRPGRGRRFHQIH